MAASSKVTLSSDEVSVRRYMKSISCFDLIDPQREIELARKRDLGDSAALEELICANLRLVVKIARDYALVHGGFLDLIQEGNKGLIKACERFDPTKGAKLSTYAGFWIRQCMQRALMQQRGIVRLPLNVQGKIRRYMLARDAIAADAGGNVSLQAVADTLKTTVEDVEATLSHLTALNPASLDAAHTTNDDLPDREMHDIIADENAAQAATAAELAEHTQLLLSCLDELTPRSRDVIERRYGLRGKDVMTLEDIGKIYNLTRERIRQLESLAMEEIRSLMHKKLQIPR